MFPRRHCVPHLPVPEVALPRRPDSHRLQRNDRGNLSRRKHRTESDAGREKYRTQRNNNREKHRTEKRRQVGEKGKTKQKERLINFCHAPRHLNNFIQMVFFSSVNPRLGGPDKKHQLFQDC